MLALVLGALAATVGCSGEPPSDDGAPLGAALGESRFGLMSVSYEHDWSDTEPVLQLKTRAQFVHFTEMDGEHVARLLGLPLNPSKDLPGDDSCKTYDLTLDMDQDLDQEESGHVELLEAGNLQVQTAAGQVTLQPRHFPGLLPFISGVVYAEAHSAIETQPAQEQQPGAVAVQTEGGEAVGAFKAQSTSPRLPRLQRVAGSPPGEDPRLRTGSGAALRWQPSDEAEGAADLLYVELRYTKGERELALRCHPRDDGDFEIPEAQVSQLVGVAGGRLTLEIVRLRRTFFGATGLDRGELRVTVRERATLLAP